MDTDSAYMALSTDTLEEVVKPHLRQKYILEKNDWLPRDHTSEHAEQEDTRALQRRVTQLSLVNMYTFYCQRHKTSVGTGSGFLG
jgi:hypothetical protein